MAETNTKTPDHVYDYRSYGKCWTFFLNYEKWRVVEIDWPIGTRWMVSWPQYRRSKLLNQIQREKGKFSSGLIAFPTDFPVGLCCPIAGSKWLRDVVSSRGLNDVDTMQAWRRWKPPWGPSWKWSTPSPPATSRTSTSPQSYTSACYCPL